VVPGVEAQFGTAIFAATAAFYREIFSHAQLSIVTTTVLSGADVDVTAI